MTTTPEQEPTPEQLQLAELQRRYLAAAHAVQAGVGIEMSFHGNPTTPKHLRTGVNMTLMQISALGGLLMRKGLITELEYFTALAEGAEQEKADYEQRISQFYGGGTKIQLV